MTLNYRGSAEVAGKTAGSLGIGIRFPWRKDAGDGDGYGYARRPADRIVDEGPLPSPHRTSPPANPAVPIKRRWVPETPFAPRRICAGRRTDPQRSRARSAMVLTPWKRASFTEENLCCLWVSSEVAPLQVRVREHPHVNTRSGPRLLGTACGGKTPYKSRRYDRFGARTPRPGGSVSRTDLVWDRAWWSARPLPEPSMGKSQDNRMLSSEPGRLGRAAETCRVRASRGFCLCGLARAPNARSPLRFAISNLTMGVLCGPLPYID